MSSHRIDRTSEDIRRELSDIIRTLKDPRIGDMLSVVRVELSNDLSYCKVFVSSLSGLGAAQSAVEGLASAAGLIRREIGARVRMRRTPEFRFVADDSIAHSAHIRKILGDLDGYGAD